MKEYLTSKTVLHYYIDILSITPWPVSSTRDPSTFPFKIFMFVVLLTVARGDCKNKLLFKYWKYLNKLKKSVGILINFK